jgi:hypothetical protein
MNDQQVHASFAGDKVVKIKRRVENSYLPCKSRERTELGKAERLLL